MRLTHNPSSITHNLTAARYTFASKERDEESGLSYFGSRYYSSDLSIWLSVDPMSDKYPYQSSYVYCSNNPINRLDLNGKTDGWIEDVSGTVFWDSNTNSQEEFYHNYDRESGYSYVSDKDNARAYTLANGEGKILVNKWNEGNVTDGCSTPEIELEFSPSNPNARVGWLQTYNSNIPDANSDNVSSLLPGSENEYRIDFQSLDETNTSVPYWNPSYDSKILQDMPRRMYNDGATRSVHWNAQSSVLVNGSRSATISWGFSIDSKNSGIFISPRIINTVDDFHLNTIQMMR